MILLVAATSAPFDALANDSLHKDLVLDFLEVLGVTRALEYAEKEPRGMAFEYLAVFPCDKLNMAKDMKAFLDANMPSRDMAMEKIIDVSMANFTANDLKNMFKMAKLSKAPKSSLSIKEQDFLKDFETTNFERKTQNLAKKIKAILKEHQNSMPKGDGIANVIKKYINSEGRCKH